MARPGTQMQPGPAGIKGLHSTSSSVYHNEIAFTHGFIWYNVKHCDLISQGFESIKHIT